MKKSLFSVLALGSFFALSALACEQRPGNRQQPQVLPIEGTPYKVVFRTPSSEQRYVDDKVMTLVGRVALYTKSNVYINSGYRSCSHNAKVKGVSRSQHLLGNAVDFSVPGYTSAQLKQIAFRVGARGAGSYCGSFSHLDLGRPRQWNWCK